MSTELSKPEQKQSLLTMLSSSVGLEPQKYYAAIKTSCGCQGATDDHFAVLMMAAHTYGLNPMLRQLYLMDTKRGISVVIPVDGWVPLMVNHPDYLAHEIVLQWDGKPFVSKCVAATCRIWTKSRNALNLGPFEHTEMMGECWRDTGPWKSHPTRMLGHKATIQGARRAFGIYVMDSDEAANIERSTPQPARPGSLTVSLPQDLPEEIVDATVEPTDLTPQHDTYQALSQQIATVKSGKDAATLAQTIAGYLSSNEITQDQADELAERLRQEMQ
jgi:hypothetical protein